MIFETEELTPREQEILRHIRKYGEDIKYDYFDMGYDEGYEANQDSGWDEGRNKGYDEGWEDACQYLLDNYVNQTGFVHTPTYVEEIHKMIEEQAPASMIVAAAFNFLHKKISNMKVDK